MWFKEIPSDLIEWIKLKPRYLFAIALSTGIYLFSSDKILNFLGFFNMESFQR